jgi:hypothetical protein
VLIGGLVWLAFGVGPASAADFTISFDGAGIVTGSVAPTQEPGENYLDDVASPPSDVVNLKGTVTDEGLVSIPAGGVRFDQQTRGVGDYPHVWPYTIEWRSPAGFTGTFDEATGELNLTGSLEQTVTQLSNSCTTGPIPVSLSTETTAANISGSRFTEGLDGDGALVGKWAASTAEPAGPDCVPSVLACEPKSDLAGSVGTIALSTEPRRLIGPPSITRCEMRTSLALNEIVYSHEGRITVSAPSGERLKELTHPGVFFNFATERGDDQPSLSPDGSMVAFVRKASVYYPDGSGIAILDRDSSQIHVLDSSDDCSSGFRDPVFDRDGTHLFYVRTGEHPAVIRSETNGANPINVAERIPELAGLELSDIDLSPDEEHLLVGMEGFSDRDGHPIARIYKVDLTTGRATLLQTDASQGAWSPNGKEIVFESKRDRIGAGCEKGYCHAQTRLFSMNAKGGAVKRVFPKRGSRNELNPDFSPDGTRITFTGDRGGSNQIYIAEPDGSCLGQLTNGNLSNYTASWGHQFQSEGVPPACGNRKPKPRIELKKVTDPPIHGLPRLWLGPSYQGNSIYAPGEFNGHSDLDYSACLRFSWKGCGHPVNVVTYNVCGSYPGKYPSYATSFFAGAVRYRGAVVEFYGPPGKGKRASTAVVFTGGRIVYIDFYSPSPYGTPRPLKWYFPVIDRLRPLWQTDRPKGKLPPARMGVNALAYYRKMLRYSRGHSIPETARRFKQNKRSARYSVKAASRYVKLKIKGIECGRPSSGV